MSSYQYIESIQVHCLDCAGVVDLALGLERLERLRSQIARRGSERAKVMADFRATVWLDETVHQALARSTRETFGLNGPEPAVYLALVNTRLCAEISPWERWFLEPDAAMEWLASRDCNSSREPRERP